MILSRVRDYLQQNRRASVVDLAHGLDATPDAVRAMLAVLERKGRARRLPAGTACGNGCCKCDPASLELYEWTGD
jgi:Mn-dependent DtxR family transcriptional regulator